MHLIPVPPRKVFVSNIKSTTTTLQIVVTVIIGLLQLLTGTKM